MKKIADKIKKFFESYDGFKNVWIYKEKIIVLEFHIEKENIVFDVSIKNDFFSVELFSRGDSNFLKSINIIDDDKKKTIFYSHIDNFDECLNVILDYYYKIKNYQDKIIDLNEPMIATYADEQVSLSDSVKSKKINKFDISDVLERGLCIGCGACNIITNGKIKINRNEYGIFSANKSDIESISESEFNLINDVCPFTDSSLNEDELDVPNILYRDLPRERRIGRYHALFASRRINKNELLASSSGGMTSWLVKSLFNSKKIDAVVHVGKVNNGSDIFEYRISYSADEAESNKKSAYYSITLVDVISELKKRNTLRYAIVGLPCFIKSVRLLAEKDERIKRSILYYLGLVCGHLKSSFFAESNAWQLGINPKELKIVDFRVKNKKNPASRYDFLAESKNDVKVIKKTSSLYGGSWGMGFFQPNACNYCDDVFAETADVVFADAWLPEFTKNWAGTNLVVSRNKEITQIFQDGVNAESIEVKNVTLDKVVASQAGGLRHRQEGLKVRLFNDLKNGLKIPEKRVIPSIEGFAEWRIDLIEQRKKLSALSLQFFKEAKNKNNYQYFVDKMKGHVELYKHIDRIRFPAIIKKKYYDVALFGWHYNRNMGGSLTVLALHQLLTFNGLSVVVVPKPGNSKITDGNKENLKIVEKYYTYANKRDFNELHELRNYCDYFVLASDQLWAGKWIAFRPEFEFLACGDKSVKKISVATSFGGGGDRLPFSEDKSEIVKYNLKKIDHVSVREPSGVEILKSIGVSGEQILDPVFLAPKIFYDSLINSSQIKIDREYIAGYILDFKEDLIKFAVDDLSQKININSNIFTTTMEHTKEKNDVLIEKWRKLDKVNFYSYPNVADFVRIISKASFVVTDSYHGACLCVIFNRPFICAPKGSRGNSRFALFEQLGLADRIVSRENIDIHNINMEINWLEVNKKLEKMRGNSLFWLSKAFDRYIKR